MTADDVAHVVHCTCHGALILFYFILAICVTVCIVVTLLRNVEPSGVRTGNAHACHHWRPVHVLLLCSSDLCAAEVEAGIIYA